LLAPGVGVRDGLAARAAGLAARPVRRLAAWGRFVVPLVARAERAGLRLEEVRALTARRTFAMPDW